MSKKIAIGIINCCKQETYTACRESLPDVDLILDVHHTSHKIKDVPQNRDIKRYISYGALYNILLREFLAQDVSYIFLIKSTLVIKDHSIIDDYINTAKTFGTYFLSRGSTAESPSVIEDETSKLNLNLYSDLRNDFVFMHKSHVKACGYFNEGYTNISDPDDANILEIYDFYHRIKNKISYLPEGYFPDTDLSLLKIQNNPITPQLSRPNLILNTTNNKAIAYGKFLHFNKFIPGQHKKVSREKAMDSLTNIQKIYGTHI